uniref:Uncharacterized protein n=1 Tax=Glossina palpalis gambiensis TaxID=67801 RepID=A0A1B0B2E5_9MUSC
MKSSLPSAVKVVEIVWKCAFVPRSSYAKNVILISGMYALRFFFHFHIIPQAAIGNFILRAVYFTDYNFYTCLRLKIPYGVSVPAVSVQSQAIFRFLNCCQQNNKRFIPISDEFEGDAYPLKLKLDLRSECLSRSFKSD